MYEALKGITELRVNGRKFLSTPILAANIDDALEFIVSWMIRRAESHGFKISSLRSGYGNMIYIDVIVYHPERHWRVAMARTTDNKVVFAVHIIAPDGRIEELELPSNLTYVH